ncbi:MAG: ABC-2 transporter permease [Clostridiales bacterium]|jgi:ABC-2 type transport system permease protein|nr:ABC-2 transporter permease [Clostridiales bacterium]
MTAILKKELRNYFNSWIGYVFLFILVGLTGIIFSLINLLNQSTAFVNVMSYFTIFMLILMPVLTMRLFAEEARQKTDQLIFTSPVTVAGIVAAKFLAALILALIGLALTFIFPLLIAPYGTLSFAPVLTAYLGYILLIAAFIAVGVFISVLTDNQIIAAVGTFVVMLVFYIMDWIASGLSSGPAASATASIIFIAALLALLAYLIYNSTKNIYAASLLPLILLAVVVALYVARPAVFDGLIVKVIRWFSIMDRFNSFNNGVINIADIVYYITFTIAFLYFSVNAIEKRRWA